MSDYTPDDLDLDPQGEEPNGPKQLRDAYKAAAAAKAAAEAEAAAVKAELDQLRRQQAFTAAGIDVNSPQGKFFAENYQGPLEEIGTKAAELGLTGTQTPVVSQQEQQVWQNAGAVAQSAVPAANVEDVNSTLQLGDSPATIAAKLRRAGEPVDSAIVDGQAGGVWLGRPNF